MLKKMYPETDYDKSKPSKLDIVQTTNQNILDQKMAFISTTLFGTSVKINK